MLHIAKPAQFRKSRKALVVTGSFALYLAITAGIALGTTKELDKSDGAVSGKVSRIAGDRTVPSIRSGLHLWKSQGISSKPLQTVRASIN
jgi:hypothetical protein